LNLFFEFLEFKANLNGFISMYVIFYSDFILLKGF